MELRIAASFIDSLARLNGDEQKAVKSAAFNLQVNPVNPGHHFHKLDKALAWSPRRGFSTTSRASDSTSDPPPVF